jgi:SAM-dependent methyltransferase
MDWFRRDFDHPAYFKIYASKEREAEQEGPALAGYLDAPPDSLVLDLPCGWGRLCPYWRQRGWKVVGGDLSPSSLAIHAERNPIDLVRLDLRRLPFKDSVADAIICAFTSWGYFLDEVENFRQINEFARVLKVGGALLLDLAGRHHLEKGMALVENYWYTIEDGDYRERARWSNDKKRIITDRIKDGHRFRHDIWIPLDSEIRSALGDAGFEIDDCWGGLDGEPWDRMSERWIYRAARIRKSASNCSLALS